MRTLYMFWVSHYQRDNYLSMDQDRELSTDFLPRGHTPVWIKPPRSASKLQMLQRIQRIPELSNYGKCVTTVSCSSPIF